MNFKTITNEEQAEILTEDFSKFEWGWFYPASAVAGVGARLIMENGVLEVSSDRVSKFGENTEEKQATAVKTAELKVIKVLEKFMCDQGITVRSGTRIYGEFEEYRCLATPNASFGYVYFSFWK